MESSTFLDLVVLFGSASLIAMVFHALRLPSLIGFITAGMIVGPHGLGLVSGQSDVHKLSEIGVVLLMFTIGVEFSFRRLIHLRRAFLGWGSLQVLLTIAAVAAAGRWFFDLSSPHAIFWGLLAALSSTAIILRILSESRQMESAQGNSLIAVLLFQDLAFIPMMLALPILATAHSASDFSLGMQGGQWMLRLAGIAATVWVCSRYLIPYVFEKIVKTRSRETFYFFVLFLCFGVSYVSEHFGMSLSLGAFVAGVIISESPYGRQAMSEIIPLRDNFLSLFFIAVGMLLDPQFILDHLGETALLACAVILVKSAITYGVGRFLRYAQGVAIATALGLAQIGEFSFILAGQGRRLGLLDDLQFQTFLSVTIVSMLLTPLLFRLAPTLGDRFRRILPPDTDESLHAVRLDIKDSQMPTRLDKPDTPSAPPHTIIIGYGIVGQDVAAALTTLEIPHKIIEMNYSEVKRLKKQGVDIIFGDASRQELLEEAEIDRAKLVVLTVSGTNQNQAILGALSRIRPDVHVIVRTQYLREAQDLVHSGQLDVVVAEYETSLEVLARALGVYGVPSSRIHEFIMKSRENIHLTTQAVTDSLRRVIDLPAWEALSSIRPLQIRTDSRADQATLEELNLRQNTGALIVSVYREGLGTTIPNAGFQLASGDVVHLIGPPDALASAEGFLGGPSVNRT